jgi:ferredoxin
MSMTDPAAGSGYRDPPPRMGFFTDTSVCIGCKACEVACKEWNHVPDDGRRDQPVRGRPGARSGAPRPVSPAVPAWHEGHREMPFVFTGSAAMAAGGLGLLAAPAAQNAPARNQALLGAGAEAVAFELMNRRMGMVAEPYSAGKAGGYVRAGRVLAAIGAAGALLGWRHRAAAAVSRAALLGGSAATRWGVFHAGLASAADPKYTVVPQRQRLGGGQAAPGPGQGT